MAVALDLKFGEVARETIKFIRHMDHFFDCFNVSSFTKGKEKRKCFLSPYRKENDFRMEVGGGECVSVYSILATIKSMSNGHIHCFCFTYNNYWVCAYNFLFKFLKELVCYLDQWKASVEGRPGFDDDQKQRMLLSATTENGIRITGVCLCVCYNAYTVIKTNCSEILFGTGTISTKHRWSECIFKQKSQPGLCRKVLFYDTTTW